MPLTEPRDRHVADGIGARDLDRRLIATAREWATVLMPARPTTIFPHNDCERGAPASTGESPRPKKTSPPGDCRPRRSSSRATIRPCHRPPRGVATFRSVSSSAIFSTGRWRSSTRNSRSAFAYRSASRLFPFACSALVGRRAPWQPRELASFGSRCCAASTLSICEEQPVDRFEPKGLLAS
jgi:hypothetical protein